MSSGAFTFWSPLCVLMSLRVLSHVWRPLYEFSSAFSFLNRIVTRSFMCSGAFSCLKSSSWIVMLSRMRSPVYAFSRALMLRSSLHVFTQFEMTPLHSCALPGLIPCACVCVCVVLCSSDPVHSAWFEWDLTHLTLWILSHGCKVHY